MKPIASCLWLAFALSAASAQSNPKAIAPGKQLGKMAVGDVVDEMKWLKKPDYGDAASGRQWQTWEAKKPDPRNGKIINSLDVFSTPNAAGKYQIRIIRSTSPTFTTKGMIKVGSSYSQVQSQFSKLVKVGEYDSPQFAAKVALFDDPSEGVGFEFKVEKDGSVNKRSRCLSVWVHEPGMNLVQDSAPIQYLTAKPSLRSAAKHG